MNARIEVQSDVSATRDRRAIDVQSVATSVLRAALVLILVVFGALKFTAAEAAAIKPLVSNSPLMSWLYSFFGDQSVSNLIGSVELVTAVLIASRRISPRASVIGSALAVGTFLATLSFLFSTPGALSPMHPAHGFLLKDVVLLGAALALGAEALRANTRG